MESPLSSDGGMKRLHKYLIFLSALFDTTVDHNKMGMVPEKTKLTGWGLQALIRNSVVSCRVMFGFQTTDGASIYVNRPRTDIKKQFENILLYSCKWCTKRVV